MRILGITALCLAISSAAFAMPRHSQELGGSLAVTVNGLNDGLLEIELPVRYGFFVNEWFEVEAEGRLDITRRSTGGDTLALMPCGGSACADVLAAGHLLGHLEIDRIWSAFLLVGGGGGQLTVVDAIGQGVRQPLGVLEGGAGVKALVSSRLQLRAELRGDYFLASTPYAQLQFFVGFAMVFGADE